MLPVSYGKPFAGSHTHGLKKGISALEKPKRAALFLKRLAKTMLTIAFLLMGASLAAAPTVSNETAKQRYPWNGLVDITCTVSGINGTTNGLTFAVVAVMPDSGTAREVSHFWVVRDGRNSTDYAVNTNGDYRLVWDAQVDLGQVRYSNMVVRVVVVHNKVRLWPGGPYWAITNIGADEPWDRGYYFWWGDVVGYRRENGAWVASDGSSSDYSFQTWNTPTYNKDLATLKSEGWITADNVLAPEHDAAQVQWGGGWRMPTEQELFNLVYCCFWTFVTTNGVNGYVIRGQGDYASASIFLPTAGYGFWDQHSGQGSYWASEPSSADGATTSSCLNNDYHGLDMGGRDRHYGCPIRPVQGFTE